MEVHTNIPEVLKYFKGKEKLFKDPKAAKRVQERVVELIREDATARFRNLPQKTGGYVLGGKIWEPTQDILIGKKQKSEMPMFKGDLERSLTTPYHSESYVSFTDTGVKVGTKNKSAKYIDKKRPLIFWHDELSGKVMEIIFEEFVS